MLDLLRRRTKSEHEQITAMLSAYLDGELTAKDRQRVEAHLSHCNACAEKLRTLQYTKALLVKAPMPRIPRSFVVRRADLEVPVAASSRRRFGPGSKLAYGYLRGATALVTVAFALVVAGDLIAHLGFGKRQPVIAPPKQAYVVEQEIVAEVTKVVEKKALEEAITVEDTPLEVEKEVEKVIVPAATPSPAMRQASPTAIPPATEIEREGVKSLAVPEAAPTQAVNVADLPPTETTAVKDVYGADEISTPAPIPTVTPPSPTLLPPTPTSPPRAKPEVLDAGPPSERDISPWPTAIRVAEIGLAALALSLLVITLIVRRQQP